MGFFRVVLFAIFAGKSFLAAKSPRLRNDTKQSALRFRGLVHHALALSPMNLQTDLCESFPGF
jgi:hypothetical protein